MHPTDSAKGPEAFFDELKTAFGAALARLEDRPEAVGALCALAFEAFEANIEAPEEGAPRLACRGECAACCGLRVVVTAPEALLLARFIGANAQGLAARGVDVPARIAALDAEVGALTEAERMAAARACPLLEGGLCLAYRLRPLACRGHASFDEKACAAAAAGENVDVPVSSAHVLLRGLVQSAMITAMREARLASGLYELNRALALALAASDAAALWARRGDPLAKAKLAEAEQSDRSAIFGASR
jgi:Fe-S-cluster containining protein